MNEIIHVDLNDGFLFDNISVSNIPHPHMKYPGIRVNMVGYFGKTRFKVSIDLGYGDFVYPTYYNLPLVTSKKDPVFESHLKISCYPLEFIFAEKLQVVVSRKGENSRMKDFHDLYLIIQKAGKKSLSNIEEIVRGVFEHRNIQIEFPIRFLEDDLIHLQKFWVAHLRGLKAGHHLPDRIQHVIDKINHWLKSQTSLIR